MSALNWLESVARRIWGGCIIYFRILNGDRAYADYLAHCAAAHTPLDAPLTRAEFYRQEIERRWNGVRRCC